MHLSKMKFCHPVSDTFSPRKFDHIGQHMDELTCMPTNFQVIFSSPFCAKCFWDGLKCFTGGLNYVKSLMMRELYHQADPSYDGILKFINFDIFDISNKLIVYGNLLLNLRLPRIMMFIAINISVQEEYEMTRMCEVAVPPDFGKPLVEDDLKSLTRS